MKTIARLGRVVVPQNDPRPTATRAAAMSLFFRLGRWVVWVGQGRDGSCGSLPVGKTHESDPPHDPRACGVGVRGDLRRGRGSTFAPERAQRIPVGRGRAAGYNIRRVTTQLLVSSGVRARSCPAVRVPALRGFVR